MGYDGITDCLAIEFDGHYNPETGDPVSAAHISVHAGGPGGPAGAAEGFAIVPAVGIGPFNSVTWIARVVYDARARTLKVYLSGNLKLTINDFDIKNRMNLDNGKAYIGILSSSGDPNITNGPSRLLQWSTAFPQACEEVQWVQPLNDAWNDTGYPGDTFDHLITGTFLVEDDVIKEELIYVSDDMGMSTGDIDSAVDQATGQWRAGYRTDAPGFRRKKRYESDDDLARYDHHSFTVSNKPSIKTFFENGGTAGTAVFIQEMTHIGHADSAGNISPGTSTDLVVARHKLTFRFVKIAPEFTEVADPPCAYSDGFIAHVIVRKQRVFNSQIWPQANSEPPVIPCWQ